ncbi:hypothetical protein GQ473_03545 [archaeon]|nr:hypothetical protein [archaeon]
MGYSVNNNRKGILHGEKGIAPTDTSVKNPYSLAKREHVGETAYHANHSVGRTQQDIRDEIAQFNTNTTPNMELEKSDFDMVIGHRDKTYGLVIGTNFTRINEINTSGNIIKYIGNVSYDPQTNNMEGVGISSDVTNYLCELLFDAPTITPDMTLPEHPKLEKIIDHMNTSFSIDGTPQMHNIDKK